jgi:hypothetical protein
VVRSMRYYPRFLCPSCLSTGLLHSCSHVFEVSQLSLFQVLEVQTMEGLGTFLDVVLVTLLDSCSHLLHFCHSIRCWR